ncbi:recombinase family protein [Phaeobacter sp. C3_T13_0]|uniref:recombinase family protein n=1 Tax=Phaeobacter cretensis TaxID=3342641 RepID=UPI0039BC8DFE
MRSHPDLCNKAGLEARQAGPNPDGHTWLDAIFEVNNVTLVSLTERFDLASPMGKGMFHIMASLAQMERDLIRERTIAGLKAARERGARHGRPQTMTPERMEKAAELALAGVSTTKIIPVMKVMAAHSILRKAVESRKSLWVYPK